MEKKTTVLIIGAGPAGLATSACLNRENIPNIVLEKDDCYASLWRKRAYGRLKLHLAKEFCELPHFHFPPNSPTFVPKIGFIKYLDDYVAHFSIHPVFNCQATSAVFDRERASWIVETECTKTGVQLRYVAAFLVVATGENSEGFRPSFPGLETFSGKTVHSSAYVDGHKYNQQNVLVVGSGNSGMEIALDLCNAGACVSIVIRSPVHVLDEKTVKLGMKLLGYLSYKWVDKLMVFLSKWKFGNLAKYGIERPEQGPFAIKKLQGRSPVIDVGTVAKIRQGLIKVYPGVLSVEKNTVTFHKGIHAEFDAIIFATGYQSTVKKWLQDEGWLFGENGMPFRSSQDHWKGENGLYCVGFARNGLFGINKDATSVVADITALLSTK